MSRSITPRVALLFAAGDVGTSLTSVCLAFYWLYFLIQVAGLPSLHAGAIHASGYVLSAGANLWAGRILDRRFPLLRDRCLLVAGLGVVMALLFASLWTLPPAPWREAWYLGLSWAFHLVFALVYLAYLSLSAALGTSEAERVDLSSYRFAGTMLLTIVVLAAHGATEGRLDLAPRLLFLGAIVAIFGAAGALACGLGLRPLMPAAPPAGLAEAPSPWRRLLATASLQASCGANLAVWFVVQATLVLTVFLCAASGASDALVLLVLQVAIIVAAALTSVAVRRWTARKVMLLAAGLWCLGAVLWLGAFAPYAAAAFLGVGLGAATVLSWASVAEALATYPIGRGRAEARAYAGLSLMRDLVAAVVPLLAAGLMHGRAVGSPESGVVAAAALVGCGLLAAGLVFSLPRLLSADADRGRALT